MRRPIRCLIAAATIALGGVISTGALHTTRAASISLNGIQGPGPLASASISLDGIQGPGPLVTTSISLDGIQGPGPLSV